MLELKGVEKSWAGRCALHPTDLVVPEGRVMVLLGPSGSGKSTLLRIMNGLIEPDGGTVWFEGAALDQSSALEQRRRMGYVIQEGGLFPHLTAQDNVTLVAGYLGWTSSRMEERLDELAELVQLERPLLRRYPSQLSGGQRQRVGLMRALMLEPRLLLLDEPLGALDPMIRSDLQADLRRIFRRLGQTVVLVTHDLGEAAYLGEEIVLLRAGHLVQRGPLSELLHRPAQPFVSQFIRAQRDPWEGLLEGER